MEKELGIFSGNHIGNLRQLPENVHRRLHRQLEDLGYDPNLNEYKNNGHLIDEIKKIKIDNFILFEIILLCTFFY